MNIKIKYLLLFVSLALILAACGVPASIAPEPITIAQGFWDAINAKNIDTAMALVADDVVTHGGGPFYSPSKTELSALLSAETEKGFTFEVTDLKLDSEDTVTYSMKIYTPKGTLMIGSSYLKLQVADGKIVLIEFP